MPDFTIRQGDRLPPLRTTLISDGSPVDLSSATSVTVYGVQSDGTTGFTGAATILTPAADGEVSYAWGSGDTDMPGRYRVQFVVTTSGLTQTYPTDRVYLVDVIPTAVADT